MIFIQAAPAYSQQPATQDSTVHKAMAKALQLTGMWSGDGWIQMGKEKQTFIQTENVVQKANGSVLIIDGIGVDATTKKMFMMHSRSCRTIGLTKSILCVPMAII